jgi:hypothetical protein
VSGKGLRGARLVAIGDLNGADDALIDILRGTGLVDGKLRWIGGRAELVQMGDVFNRGGGALRAFRLLRDLRGQARAAGGRVTMLLGNHEVMTALGHEGYCTEAEYLSFASATERRAWPARVARAMRRIVRQRSPRGPILPIAPRLEAWKIEHVPGRAALRRALGPRANLGKLLRALPVVHTSFESVFVHAGLLPAWAKLGAEGVNTQARITWSEAPPRLWKLQKSSLFRDPRGPLWDRSLVLEVRSAAASLRESLALLGARRMIIGHTQTSSVAGGVPGKILTLHGGRLVLVDVGLRAGEGGPRTALIVTASEGLEWTPAGTRVLWSDRRPRASR